MIPLMTPAPVARDTLGELETRIAILERLVAELIALRGNRPPDPAIEPEVDSFMNDRDVLGRILGRDTDGS